MRLISEQACAFSLKRLEMRSCVSNFGAPTIFFFENRPRNHAFSRWFVLILFALIFLNTMRAPGGDVCSRGPPSYRLFPGLPSVQHLRSPHEHRQAVSIIPRGHPILHEAMATSYSSAASLVASIVPDFPRLFPYGPPNSLPRLPGFNANDAVRLFLPDLANPSNIYPTLLLLSSAAAFLYWEGGGLWRELEQEQELERLEEDFEQSSGRAGGNGPVDEAALKARAVAAARARAARERRRALGWLALVTALAVWCTGLVNVGKPFQP